MRGTTAVKMNKTVDDEQYETTFSITNYEFKAVVRKGALPDSLRAVQIEDRGGVIVQEVFPVETANSKATQLLWQHYTGNTPGSDAEVWG
jgi:hypothetical protein